MECAGERNSIVRLRISVGAVRGPHISPWTIARLGYDRIRSDRSVGLIQFGGQVACVDYAA